MYRMNLIKSFAVVLFTVSATVSAFAQPAGYANQQSNSTAGVCVGCGVDNPNNSVDGDEDTFAQLNIPVGLAQATIQQTLQFPFVGVTGDEVVLIMGVTDVLDINALGNIKINTFLGGNPNNEQIQIDISGVTALGSGKFEFKFNAAADFDAVQALMEAPTTGLSSNLKIYAAKVTRVVQNGLPFPQVCVTPDATATGVDGTCINLLGIGCEVNTPQNAIDGDESTSSELLVELGSLGGGPFQTFTVDDAACGVDSVNLILGANDNNGSALDLLGLNINPSAPGEEDGAIEVAAVDVNGNVIPGTEQYVDTESLTLIGGGGLRYNYTYVPPANLTTYFGVRVWYHGVTFVSGLNIFEVCVNRFQPPLPGSGSAFEVCFNDTAVLSVNPSPNTVAYWYADSIPNDLENDAIFIGSNFNPSNNNPGFTFTNDTSFYVYGRNVDKDCFSVDFTEVFVDVFDELPDPIQLDIEVCFGATEDIFPQPFGPIYNMYEDPNGNTPILLNAQAFRVGPIISDTTFYVQTTNEDGCVSANIVPINVTLKEEQFFAETDTLINACLGEDVTVSLDNPVAGVTYNWYTAPMGGSLVFTGTDYTFNLTGDTDLYIDAVAVAGGCDSSAFRKFVDVNAVPKPTLTPADTFLLVCPGDSVQAIAQSSAGEVVWFDAPTGGNELFRGNAFTIVDNGGDQVVYAQATNDRCPADTRQAYTIKSTSTLLGELNDLSTAVCSGDDITITAPTTANVDYTFWDQPVGGSQIGVGPSVSFTNLQADTTVYIQIEQANCSNVANERTAVTVTVTTPPSFDVVTDELFGCLGDTVSFEIDNPNPAFTYNWYDEQGALVFTGPVFDVEIVSDTAIFFAEAAEGLCTNPNRIEVTLYRGEDLVNPQVNAGNPTVICKGDGINITATSRIPGGTYKWYTDTLGNNLITTGANLQLVGPFNNDTVFYVQVQYQNICGDGFSDFVPAVIDARDVLPSPLVSCGASGTDFVTFEFDDIPNTTAFVVSVNDGVEDTIPGSQLQYVVNNLDPDETVEIKVRRLGVLACETSVITSFTCTSEACAFDVVQPAFLVASDDICTGEDYTFTLDPGTVPNGDYTVSFTNNNSGATDNLQNATDFAITMNNGTARSYMEVTGDPVVYTYTLVFEMINQPGCENTTITRNIQLTVNPVPNVKFIATATTPAVVGQFINTFVFNDLTAGVKQEDWSFGDGETLTVIRTDGDPNPPAPVTHTYDEEGTYIVTLQVTNAFGCVGVGTLEQPITVSTVPEIFIPNTFTPNGDGNNDEFKVFGENIELKKMRVYNHYGNEVYRGSGLENGWDGTYEGEDQPSGVYAYIIEIEDFLGNIYNREGSVTLIRK